MLPAEPQENGPNLKEHCPSEEAQHLAGTLGGDWSPAAVMGEGWVCKTRGGCSDTVTAVQTQPGQLTLLQTETWM